ncbi:hypothetical protein GCM10017711_27100 [Paeniglutamicibacter sulfureus]
MFCDLGTPSPDWNVFDQLREDLAARGVPGEEVRFMHEARNDAEKGRLVGCSQEMGVGPASGLGQCS